MKTTPFRISVPEAILDDLRDRLARTRWPDQPEDAGWGLGTDLAFMKRLASTGATRYDWRAQEAALNAPPAVHRRRRRDRAALRARARQGPEPDAAAVDPRLPRLVLPVPEGDRAADRSGRARRRSQPVVRRRDPQLPGFGFSATTPMSVDADGGQAGGADEGPRLRALHGRRRRRPDPDGHVASATPTPAWASTSSMSATPTATTDFSSAVAARDGVRAVDPGLVDARRGVQHDPVDQAAEPGVRAERLAGGPGRLADDPVRQRRARQASRSASRWTS